MTRPHAPSLCRPFARAVSALLVPLVVGSILAGGGCTPTSGDSGDFDPVTTTNSDFVRAFVTVGNGPLGLAVADSDGLTDGNTTEDLAVTNFADNTVSILLNDGSGVFTETVIATGAGPSQVLWGDFDGAGPLDLAVLNATSRTLTILLNDGKGAGWSPTTLVPGGTVTQLSLIHLDGGVGAADLVLSLTSDETNDLTTDPDPMVVFVNEPPGTFRKVPTDVANALTRFAIGDWDGNGVPDLAVLSHSGDRVHILLGDGLGAFSPAPVTPSIAVGDQPHSIVTADFDGDSLADLALTVTGSSQLVVLLGKGAGEFAHATGSPLGVVAQPTRLLAADFGTGSVDVVVLSSTGERVGVYRNDGSAEFSASASVATNGDPIALVTGDYNGDGLLDVAVAEATSRALSILAGDGAGNFTRTVLGFEHTPTFPRTMNVNDDGLDDLVVLQSGADRVLVLVQVP